MQHPLRNDYDTERAMQALWVGWIMGLGATTLLLVLSLVVTAGVLPIFAFAMSGGFLINGHYGRQAGIPSTYIVPYIMARVLLWVGLVMVVCLIVNRLGLLSSITGDENNVHPYIPMMVIGPVVCIYAAVAWLRGNKFGYFEQCRMANGQPAEQGQLGRLLFQEARYQVKFLTRLSAAMTVVTYVYYFCFYIDVNLNSPDKFAFVWLPVIFYAVSLGYLGARYFSLSMYYNPEARGNHQDSDEFTSLRFLIFDSDSIFLTGEQGDAVDSSAPRRLDTPVAVTLSHRERLSQAEAEKYFHTLTQLEQFKLRFMYLSNTAGSRGNVFHYIATVHHDAFGPESKVKGNWHNMSQLNRYMANGTVTPMLAAEINRLYTITMAWKAYDLEGRRLYKVKNFKPTFRLADINNWEVDFNDSRWLSVAHNNQDRPFFALRKLWYRYIGSSNERTR